MQANGKTLVKQFKMLVDKTIEAVKEKQKGDSIHYDLNFAFGIQAGTQNDSKTLSDLDKLKQALTKYADEDVVTMSFNLVAIHPANEQIEGFVEKAMQAAAALEESRPKLVTG